MNFLKKKTCAMASSKMGVMNERKKYARIWRKEGTPLFMS